MLVSSTSRIFSTVVHIMSHKPSHNIFQSTKITLNISADHCTIKIGTKKRICLANHYRFTNYKIRSEVTMEIRKYSELNDNQFAIYTNL